MERQYLPSILVGEEILMRQVDDFLYVTPYIDRARTFAETLLKGAVQVFFQWLTLMLVLSNSIIVFLVFCGNLMDGSFLPLKV